MKSSFLHRFWPVLLIFTRRCRVIWVHNLRTVSQVWWYNLVQILSHICVYKRSFINFCKGNIIWPVFTQSFWLQFTFSLGREMLWEDVMWVLLCKVKLTSEALVKLVVVLLSRDLMNQLVIWPYLHVLRHFMIAFKAPPLASLRKRPPHNWRVHLNLTLRLTLL
jgi:hypothetical protein